VAVSGQGTTPASATTPIDGPTWLQRALCKKCFEAASGIGTEATPTDRPPDPEGVAALLAIATEAVDDERERGRTLDTKTASLAGFSGIILSVHGLLAGPIFKQKLGSVGHPLAEVSFFIAMACLLMAVLLAIVGVLMPQKYRGLGRKQLRNFSWPEVQAEKAIWVHQSMLGALAVIMSQDRPVNDCKARLTKGVAGFLALAFIFLAIEAATLGVQHVGV
jgi:hypothetical protein